MRMVFEVAVSASIGLVPPWLVEHMDFTMEEKRLYLNIYFPKVSRFACPGCSEESPVYDTRELAWRKQSFLSA